MVVKRHFKGNDFLKAIFDIAIIQKNLTDYKWVNSKCDLIVCFIENYPLNPQTVKSVIDMSQQPYPIKWLIKRIQNSFSLFPSLKAEFSKIAVAESLTLPSEFV